MFPDMNSNYKCVLSYISCNLLMVGRLDQPGGWFRWFLSDRSNATMANLFTLNEVFYSNVRCAKDRTKVNMDTTKFLKQDRVGITQVVPFLYGYAHTTAVAIGNYGSHQFGSQYGKSPETCVMPSRKRLEETGNPYPLDITSIENVGSDKRFCEPKYRHFVVMSYYVWEYLLDGNAYSAVQLFDNDELVAKAESEVSRQLQKGYVYDRKTVIDRNLFATQLMHMLRDLEYVGLTIANKDGLRKLTTPFAVQPAVLDAIIKGRDAVAAKAATKAAKAATKAVQPAKAKAATPAKAKAKAAPKSLVSIMKDVLAGKAEDTSKEVTEEVKEESKEDTSSES